MTDSQKNSGRIVVLGLGNMLLKDEGIGVHVAQWLQEKNLPGNVEVIDGGTSSLDILLLQEGPYKLVVVDAMKTGKKPGTIYKARFERKRCTSLPIFSATRKIRRSACTRSALLTPSWSLRKPNAGPMKS